MIRPMALGALLLSLAAAPPAFADNTADEADLAFALGNQSYAARHYQDALRSYFLSYRLVPNRNVLFNIARCYEALERFDEAYRYYRELSRLMLPAEDEKEVSRSLQRLRPRVALVTITSEPPGADLYVDREDLGSRGQSPLTLALPPGAHLLLVRKAGHRPLEAQVTLQRGREVTKAFALVPVTGKVALSGEPAGAWIRTSADGPDLATLPCDLALPPGRHILYVGAPGHATKQLLVEVKADRTTAQTVNLGHEQLPTGKLVVTANRSGASVEVDGVEAGFTPAVLTLSEGFHDLVLSLPELTPYRARVHVVRDEEQRLHADLRYSPPPVKAASKSLVSVDEAPASITVITREEIDAFGYQTLADALAAVRGVSLSDDRDYRYVGIRGFSPPGDLNTRILILWDGHALNDVWAGQGFSARDLDVDLGEVERIEVVRGPGSALYGTGAFFAVINLVPRDTLGPSHNVEATAGAAGLGAWNGHLATSYRAAPGVSVLLSGAAYEARGADLTSLQPLGNVFGQDGEKAYGASLRARLGGLTLFAQVNNRHKLIPTAPFGSALNAHGTQTTDARGFAEARFDRELQSGGSVSVRGYYDGSRYRGTWPTPVAPGSDQLINFRDAGGADWAGTEARFRFPLFSGNFLSVGAEAQLQFRITQELFSETSQPLDTHRRTLLSAYLLDEWRVHPRVFASFGLRVDRSLDLEATPLTPRLALVLEPYAHGVTKLVAGQAFRAPNAYELYYYDLFLSQRPADGIEPETITTFELEHSHDLTPELRLSFAGYHNRIRNLVILDTDEAPTPRCGSPVGTEQCFVYRNAPGLLRAFGAEAGLHWQPGRHVLVDATYSCVHLVGASPEISSGAPEHLASGKVLFPLLEPSVRLALQATYQSARFSDRVPGGAGEALLVNAGLSGQTEHFRYFAGVQNLFDVQYALPVGTEFDVPAVPQYGRTFTVQLTGLY